MTKVRGKELLSVGVGASGDRQETTTVTPVEQPMELMVRTGEGT